MKTSKAFTLIELLIVIVIIGILAVALIPRLTGAQDRARTVATQKILVDFRSVVFLAQTNTNKSLAEITNNQNTRRYCDLTQSLKNIPDSSQCMIDRLTSLGKIEKAAGMESGALSYMNRDARGSPYWLDENEGEFSNDPCLVDRFASVGEDGIYSGGSSDIIFMRIPPAHGGCPGAY